MKSYVIIISFLCGLFVDTVTERDHCSAANDGSSRPNILYILADDLGFSDLGCFGGEIDTPNLDGLARDGVRLTQFYNTGRCCPSRAALLTGQYPHRVGLGHMTGNDLGHPGYRGVVSDDAKTISEVLSSSGYRCFMAGKWHLGTADPTKRGFEEFYGTRVSAKRFFDPTHLYRKPDDRKAIEYPPGKFYATDAVTDHALEFLTSASATPDKPWFLYLAYNAPHFPLHAPQNEIAKYANRYHIGWDKLRQRRLSRMKELGIVSGNTKLSKRSQWRNYGETKTGVNPAWKTLSEDRRGDLARRMAIYAAMVDRMDQQIGRVIERLRKTDELSNTLIVFTSDNGACFEWDPFGFDHLSSNQNVLHTADMLDLMGRPGTFHSVGSAWANASNTPWRLYKHFNHEGGIASPGIVHWPDRLKTVRGAIDRQPAHLIDLMPTAVAASNANYDGVLPMAGVDLIEQINQGGKPRRLFFEHQGNRAVRDGKWKLVALDDQPWELYDLSIDRIESKDLAETMPERVNELSEAWNEWATENHVTPLPTDLRVKYLKVDEPRNRIAVMETAFNKRADASSFLDAKKAGYRAMQMHSGMPDAIRKKPIDPAIELEISKNPALLNEWKKAADEHGIEVVSLCAGSLNRCQIWDRDRKAAMRIAKQTVDACHTLGVKRMLFPFFGPSNFQESDEAFDGVAQFLDELLPYAAKRDVVIGIEAPVTTERVMQLIKQLGYPRHLKVYYDTSNLFEKGRHLRNDS